MGQMGVGLLLIWTKLDTRSQAWYLIDVKIDISSYSHLCMLNDKFALKLEHALNRRVLSGTICNSTHHPKTGSVYSNLGCSYHAGRFLRAMIIPLARVTRLILQSVLLSGVVINTRCIKMTLKPALVPTCEEKGYQLTDRHRHFAWN